MFVPVTTDDLIRNQMAHLRQFQSKPLRIETMVPHDRQESSWTHVYYDVPNSHRQPIMVLHSGITENNRGDILYNLYLHLPSPDDWKQRTMPGEITGKRYRYTSRMRSAIDTLYGDMLVSAESAVVGNYDYGWLDADAKSERLNQLANLLLQLGSIVMHEQHQMKIDDKRLRPERINNFAVRIESCTTTIEITFAPRGNGNGEIVLDILHPVLPSRTYRAIVNMDFAMALLNQLENM